MPTRTSRGGDQGLSAVRQRPKRGHSLRRPAQGQRAPRRLSLSTTPPMGCSEGLPARRPCGRSSSVISSTSRGCLGSDWWRGRPVFRTRSAGVPEAHRAQQGRLPEGDAHDAAVRSERVLLGWSGRSSALPLRQHPACLFDRLLVRLLALPGAFRTTGASPPGPEQGQQAPRPWPASDSVPRGFTGSADRGFGLPGRWCKDR